MAWNDYENSATRSRVHVRMLHRDECAAADDLLISLWDASPTPTALLMAMEHAGSYVAGAFDGDRMVGVCVGFFGAPGEGTLHSHVAGVLPNAAGRGVGTTMKLHQRAWCLDRGVGEMTWTFDPLVARNAAFNVRRLGATLDEYLVDFYGVMTDGVNVGQGSDRMLARWRLNDALPSRSRDIGQAHAALGVGADGEPVVGGAPHDAAAVTMAVPDDIEQLRRSNPELAAAWRLALRAVMVPRWDRGWRPTVVGRDGCYLMEAP